MDFHKLRKPILLAYAERLLQRDITVERRCSLLCRVLDFFTFQNRRVVAEQRNNVGLFFNKIFFHRMQSFHIFGVIDQCRGLSNHFVISRIIHGRHHLLAGCPQGQKLRRIITGCVALTGKFKITIINLIIEDARFYHFQFTVNADVFPHRFQNLSDIGMDKGRRILIFDFQRMSFIIAGFL